MKTYREKFLSKKEKVTESIKQYIRDHFGEEPQEDYETCWPYSKWCTIMTETKTFSVELKIATGKIVQVFEEKS